MKITISVDDVHPETGWGLPGDQPMEYLNALHDEFGAKFTLFIPSNYHYKFPIGDHKDWIDWLKTQSQFELAAHGHYHQTDNPGQWGECEFAEITDPDVCRDRLHLIRDEWNKVGKIPDGWRHPGWLCQPVNVAEIGHMFSYVALHYEHNRGLKWPCLELYGHDGINTTDISTHNGDVVMFQSHIAGDWNDNVWSQQNYDQMRLSLGYLKEQHPGITFCTLNHLIA